MTNPECRQERRTFPDGYVEDLGFDVDSGLLHGIWPTNSPRKDSPMFYYDYRPGKVWERIAIHPARVPPQFLHRQADPFPAPEPPIARV